MQKLEKKKTEQENLARIVEFRIRLEVERFFYNWIEIFNQEGTVYNTVYNTATKEQAFALRMLMGAS